MAVSARDLEILGAFMGFLEGLWHALRSLWKVLKASWNLYETFWGVWMAQKEIFGDFGALSGGSWSPLERRGALLGPLGRVLGSS